MPDPKLPQNKQEAAFQRLLAKVPSRPPVTLAEAPEEVSAFRELEGKLSPAAKQALAKLSEASPPEVSGDTQPRWCVCESPEGEFARVRIFKDLEGLCRYLGRIEGEEVSVWPFYGVAMRLTRPLVPLHDHRVLLLPGEHEAVVLPRTPLEQFQRLDVSLLPDLTAEHFQNNGWLGLPALAETDEYSEGNEVVRQQKATTQPPANPDEDDDPDHDQEDHVPK